MMMVFFSDAFRILKLGFGEGSNSNRRGLLWLRASPAFAQRCAMCYSTAAASKEGQRAISRAVLVLLFPPVGLMTVGVGLALRYAKERDDDLASAHGQRQTCTNAP
jgi:hypothetical protein